MKHKKLLWGLLILCCLLFVRPAEGRAAAKVYTINIAKTTPAAAEKKLRRMKASSKQELQLKVDVTGEKGYKNEVIKKIKIPHGGYWCEVDGKQEAINQKLAEKKLLQWLRQFQKVKANTYGLLPVCYDALLVCYFKEASGIYTTNITACVSDYVNMSTICEKAYDATQGKCEYRGHYMDAIELTRLNYYGNRKEWVSSEADVFADIPVRQYTKAELKKQSDSVRVQCLMYGVSKENLFKIKYVSSKKMKDSLYDIANGDGVLCSDDDTYWTSDYYAFLVWKKLAYHLSLDIDLKPWAGYLNPTFGTIIAKNASGGLDYYAVSGTWISTEYNGTESYDRLEEMKHPSNDAKKAYNWITKGKATEADEYYLRQALKCFSDGSYMDDYLKYLVWEEKDTPVNMKVIVKNKNKTKYGFTSVSYTVNDAVDESGQKTWKVTKN